MDAVSSVQATCHESGIGAFDRLCAVWRHTEAARQYLSLRYRERLREVGADASVGSVGDSYDNAMAESLIGLYKTEVIHHLGPWRGQEDVEYATLESAQWYNDERVHSELDYLSPKGYEERYPRTQIESVVAA